MPSTPQPLVVAPTQAVSSKASRARLERMFNEHHDFIWRLLRRLGVSREKADDASQNVFVVAAERVDSIKLGSERAFLFGTALRVARSQHRSEQRWVLDDEMDGREAQAPSTEALAEQRMAVDLMDRALSTMEIDLRTTFVLFELEGLSTPEIAALAEIPLGTAASRLRRAREQFRQTVAQYENEKKSTAGSQP